LCYLSRERVEKPIFTTRRIEAMRELVFAVVELVAYLLGTGALAVAGLFAEWSSLSYLSSGNHLFALWLAVMGAIALYAAFSVGTERLLPSLDGLTS
jgi:hypothetical protein